MLVSHILLTSRPIHTRIINTMPWGLRDATPGWSLCFMTLPAICARTPTKARNALKNVIEQFIPEQAMRLHPQMRCTSVFSQVTFVLALSLGLRILQDESQNNLSSRAELVIAAAYFPHAGSMSRHAMNRPQHAWRLSVYMERAQMDSTS